MSFQKGSREIVETAIEQSKGDRRETWESVRKRLSTELDYWKNSHQKKPGRKSCDRQPGISPDES